MIDPAFTNARRRPSPPRALRRKLRQEAGFGCCRCGCPFLEYHHIVPYAQEAHFRAADMMVLCAQCHHLCTVGAITEAEQREMKAAPKNVTDGRIQGELFVTTPDLTVDIGGTVAINSPNLLTVAGQVLLKAERDARGRILISAMLFDRAGQLVAALRRNEWHAVVPALWDVEVYPRRGILRERQNEILFDVDCRGDQVKIRGRWNIGSQPFVIRDTAIEFGSFHVQGNVVRDVKSVFWV